METSISNEIDERNLEELNDKNLFYSCSTVEIYRQQYPGDLAINEIKNRLSNISYSNFVLLLNII